MHDEKKHGKWIPGYEGRYSVTTEGEVWSFKRKSPLKMKVEETKNGYCAVVVKKEPGSKPERLKLEEVALSALGPTRPGAEWVAFHKDGDPRNNALKNLEWAPPTPQRRVETVHGKEIPGFGGLYSVTKDGVVWSFKGRVPVELSPGVSGGGSYLLVGLWRDGAKKSESKTVHSLVALTYLGPAPDGMEVCHKNGDPSDPRLSNLRYGTSKENSQDMIRHGRSPRGERQGCSKLTDVKAKLLKSELFKSNGKKPSQRSLAKKYGVSEQLVCDIKKGRRWAWL